MLAQLVEALRYKAEGHGFDTMKSTGYPLHSPVSPSLPLLCLSMCHHVSTGLDKCIVVILRLPCIIKKTVGFIHCLFCFQVSFTFMQLDV